jgi:hypothetical protein
MSLLSSSSYQSYRSAPTGRQPRAKTTMGCHRTDGIAEYNLANDSSPSHLGTVQVTRAQPGSARAQPNLRLLHRAAPSRCAIAIITAAAVLPLLPVSAAHCRCAIATAIAVPLLLLLPLPHNVPYFAAAATAAEAYFLLQWQWQPKPRGCSQPETASAQPKSHWRSPSLRGSILSYAQLPFDCYVYNGAMPLFVAQCVRCRRLFGGTSQIKAAIIKRHNV